jgi:uncharacterized membrane protein
MDGIFIIIGLFLIFGPIVFAVVAFNRAGRAEQQVQELRTRLLRLEMRDTLKPFEAPPPAAAPDAARPAAQPAEVAHAPVAAAVAPPVLELPPVAPAPPPLPVRPVETAPPPLTPPPVPETSFEITVGGKLASFVGIGIFVIGIVFLVGYAIQHNWIGPGLRVTIGLLTGGVLVVAGHLAEVRSDRLQVLARALTGGGAALFYFTVFAAHGIYHLIGPVLAGLGLAASAAAVFALAALYRSQAVAILGLLGAFLTPPLIHGHLDRGLFPMLYVAVINLPVLLLGLRRNWQILYNLALALTALLAAVWLERELAGHPVAAYAFTGIFFLEFALLSVLKAGQAERSTEARAVDLIRQGLTGLLLLGALFWITDELHHEAWRGGICLAVAVGSIGLARFTAARAGGLREEALGFLLIALTFASLALPAQLDGAWVSLGWGIEGVLLCWFGLRTRSTALQGAAFLLALLGLGKSLVFDALLFAARPTPFLNSRFAVGVLSAGLLMLQGWLQGRARSRADEEPEATPVSDLLTCAGLLAVLVVGVADAAFTAHAQDAGVWFFVSVLLAAVAVGATLVFAPGRLPFQFGTLLLVLLPLALLVLGAVDAGSHSSRYHAFATRWYWARLALLGAALWWFTRLTGARAPAAPTAATFFLVALGSAVALVSLEIRALHTAWADSGLTIFWAVCALALVGTGLYRRRRYLRLAGLALFGLATAKVLLVDLADLRGLQRVAACMGAGLLLLGLSFAYQKLAPVLMAAGADEERRP